MAQVAVLAGNLQIRKMNVQEYLLLNDFLYEAIFIPAGAKAPSRDITSSPEMQVYIDQFGTRKDDHALVAEADGKVVGAVWVRIMNDYGHIDNTTPSLAISLYPEYRGLGIGTCLMQEMLSFLQSQEYKRVSLSVQKANYAARLYQKLGFEVVKENGEEWIMLWQRDRI